MKNETTNPNVFLKKLYNKTTSIDRFAYLCGFFVCLFVNAFVYTNICFVHDSLMVYNDSTGITNGRLLVGPLMELTNRLQLPWVIGIISCFLMGFVVMYLSRIYSLKNKLSVFIAAGVAVTCDTIVICHLYFSSLYIFVFSLLMSIISVYIFDKYKYGYVFSVVFIVISLLAYQSFIAVTIGLFIFKLIKDLLENDKKVKERIVLIIKYASVVIVSVLLYYMIWQLVLKTSKIELSYYYAYKNLHSSTREENFILSILSSIGESFMLSISQLLLVIKPSVLYTTIAVVLNMIALLFLIPKKISSKAFMFIYVISYVVSINIIYVLSSSVSNSLTCFSVILPILILLYAIDNKKINTDTKIGNGISWVICSLCIVLIFAQGIDANSIYLRTKLNYDKSYSYSTRLVSRLESTEGFDKDTEVILMGQIHNQTPYGYNEEILKRSIGPFKTNPYDYITNDLSITATSYTGTLKWFMQQVMDMDIDIEVNPEDLLQSDEIRNMPNFPAEGSIEWLDGKLIVKVSDFKEKEQ